MTVEINNIVANNFLSFKLHWIVFEEIIPKVSLFFCHVSTQGLSDLSEILAFWKTHISSSVTPSICHHPPTPKGVLLRFREGFTWAGRRQQSLIP
jgi:hypothetical protein